MKAPIPVLRSTIIAALGGLLFGFDTAVISGATGALETVFQLTPGSLGFTVAIALVGTVVGSIVAGKPSDRYGRKVALLGIAALYAVSSIGTGFAWDWHSFLFFRFLGGIAVGGASVVSPMYIAEISPAPIRGRLVAMQQFNVCLGICLAYVSNYAIAVATFIPGDIQWRWMFAVQAFPSALFFLLIFAIPESPRWLVERRRVAEAKRVLTSLQAADVDQEMSEIVQSFEHRQGSDGEPLFCRKYSFPVMAAVLLAAFNQLTGINALLYYAPKVFALGNSNAQTALLQSIPVGIMLVISTTIGMMVIDRFGRKTLLLVGSVGMVVFLALVAFHFYTADAPNEHRPQHHVVFHRLHPFLWFLARGGDLGFYFRDIPQRRASEGASPGQLHALVRRDGRFAAVSGGRRILLDRSRKRIHVLFGDDGFALLVCLARPAGNEVHFVGKDSKATGD